MTGKRVILFGASGFLGRAVSGALDRDERISAVIRVARRHRDGAGSLRHDLVADSPDDLADLVQASAPDAVVSCVGRLDGTAAEMAAANTVAAARLLDAVAAAAPDARLVTIASAAEYGAPAMDVPVAEHDPAHPVSAYGVTKLAATQLLELAVRTRRVDAVALRVFNPVGPGLPPETLIGRAAARMRTALKRGEEQISMGPLGAYRDFVDVRDVATVTCEAVLADHLAEPVLNVGTGSGVTARKAVELLAEVAGFTGLINESAAAPGRSAGVNRIVADISAAEHALGWVPTYGLRESLQGCWDSSG